MEFGERLKELRTGLNISQKELSEKTGLTLRTIQRIENNEVKPSLYSVKAISDALELASSELLNTSDTKPYEFNVNLKITDMNQTNSLNHTKKNERKLKGLLKIRSILLSKLL